MNLAALMEESPVADNHGRKTARIVQEGDRDHTDAFEGTEPVLLHARPRRSLSDEDAENRDALNSGGRAMVLEGEETYHGMVAHRGVLTEDEADNLDWCEVERHVEEALGTTMEELARMYATGRPSADRLKRRAEIDARLLQVQEAGGNMHQLAVILGWPIETTPTGVKCRKMSQALARARGDR